MSTYDSYWSRGLVLPDDYLNNLDVTALSEIRGWATKLAGRARLSVNKQFFNYESNRLLEIINERIQDEHEEMIRSGER